MYGWKHRIPLTGRRADYFIHNGGNMIPRNDVLIDTKSSTRLKKEGCGESGAVHFLFNDFVQKNDKLRRYKQKTDFEDPLHSPLHFAIVVT